MNVGFELVTSVCEIGSVLHQWNYSANMELVILWVRNEHIKDMEMKTLSMWKILTTETTLLKQKRKESLTNSGLRGI